MIKFAAFSEVFKSSKKSQLIYCQSISFPSILSTIDTIFKVQILNKINIFLAKRNLNQKERVCSRFIKPSDTSQIVKTEDRKKIKTIFFNILKFDSITDLIYSHTRSKSLETALSYKK